MSGVEQDAHLPGLCLCGNAQLRITGPFCVQPTVTVITAKSERAAPLSAQARIAQEHFELISGHESCVRSPPRGRPKVFCVRCSSSLFSGNSLTDAEVSIRPGIFDGDPAIRPEAHLYIDSAPRWCRLPEDDLTKLPGRLGESVHSMVRRPRRMRLRSRATVRR